MSAWGGAVFVRRVATLGGGRFVAAGISALWLVVAARQLPVEQFGDLAALLAIGTILAAVSDLGYPFLVSHAVAEAGSISETTLRFVIRRRIPVGVAVAVVTSALYLVVASDDSLAIPLLYGVSLLATVVYSSVSAALRGLHRYRPEALNEVLSRIGVLALGWLLLVSGGGLPAAVGVYAAADLASLVFLTRVARRCVVKTDDGIDLDGLRLRANLHLTTGRVFASAYARLDTWLMALLRGSANAALYGAPYRLLDGLLLIPRAAGAVVVPHFGTRSAARDLRRTALLTAVAMAIVAAPLVAFSASIMTAVFGERYAASADAFAVLAASSVPGAVVVVLLPLAALRAPRAAAWIMGGALAVNTALNLALIPRFGPVGAASTTLGCQVVLAVVLLTAVRDQSTRPATEGAPGMSSMRCSATRASRAVSSSTTI
ncbi:MAG TPA: oligosaccharide flippase family protein [Acidimicrobiia bacterium]